MISLANFLIGFKFWLAEQNIKVWLLVFLIPLLILSEIKLYQKGLYDGEWNYKHSTNMQFALDSAYDFGYMDCERSKQ